MSIADLPLLLDCLLDAGQTALLWVLCQVEAALWTMPTAFVDSILHRWQTPPSSPGGWPHPLLPVAIATIVPCHE